MEKVVQQTLAVDNFFFTESDPKSKLLQIDEQIKRLEFWLENCKIIRANVAKQYQESLQKELESVGRMTA